MADGEIEGVELREVIGRVFVWRSWLRFEREAIFFSWIEREEKRDL